MDPRPRDALLGSSPDPRPGMTGHNGRKAFAILCPPGVGFRCPCHPVPSLGGGGNFNIMCVDGDVLSSLVRARLRRTGGCHRAPVGPRPGEPTGHRAEGYFVEDSYALPPSQKSHLTTSVGHRHLKTSYPLTTSRG